VFLVAGLGPVVVSLLWSGSDASVDEIAHPLDQEPALELITAEA